MTKHFARPRPWLAIIALVAAGPVQGQTVVPFNGIVIASCVLTTTTSGLLGVNSASGTEIGSEQTGGSPATLTVVATAGTPTISFSAPTMSVRPSAYAGTPTISLRYSSLHGANQGYVSATSQYTSTSALGDIITLHAKATDAAGFPAGSYRLQTLATCQQ